MATFDTLTDDFNTADTLKWVNAAGGGGWPASASVSNGELVLMTDVNFTAHLQSVNVFDVASSSFYVQVTQRPLTGSANESEFVFLALSTSNTYVGFSLLGNGQINCLQVTNGTTSTSVFQAIDTSATPFVRLRHATKFYWEKSANASTWTAITNANRNAAMPLTGLKVSIEAGHWGTHDPLTAKIASYNMVHVPPGGGDPPPTTANMMMAYFGGG